MINWENIHTNVSFVLLMMQNESFCEIKAFTKQRQDTKPERSHVLTMLLSMDYEVIILS